MQVLAEQQCPKASIVRERLKSLIIGKFPSSQGTGAREFSYHPVLQVDGLLCWRE